MQQQKCFQQIANQKAEDQIKKCKVAKNLHKNNKIHCRAIMINYAVQIAEGKNNKQKQSSNIKETRIK